MSKAKKFRMTKELTEGMSGEEKALATLSGVTLVTTIIDAPETAVSVVEDVAGKIGSAWSSFFDD